VIPIGAFERPVNPEERSENTAALTIIRRAYSYRDNEDMKLTIIQACSSLGTVRPYEISPTNSS
jgi:hypothetical protein